MKSIIKLIVGLAATLLVVGLAYGGRCQLRNRSTERRAQQLLAAIPDTVDSATANAEIAAAAKDTTSKAGQYQPPTPEEAAAVSNVPVTLTPTEVSKRCVLYNPLWWQLSMVVVLLIGIGVTWRWLRANKTVQ